MKMINNINLYSSLFNTHLPTSSGTSEIDEIIAANKQESTSSKQDQLSGDTNLFLSTKAQKINSLSNEFFNQGGLNFDDIDVLKERVYELGLISKQEYAHLTNTELTNEELEASKDVSSQNIAHFVGDFLKRLNESEADKVDNADEEEPYEENEKLIALKEALSKAQLILTNVEQAKTDPKFKESLANAITLVKETISTDAFKLMSLDDKVGLSKVHQGLEIVDKISPQRLSNDKLNQYIQVALD
jgi:hypothetical protein